VKGIGRIHTSVIETYHRPTTLEEALALLTGPGAAILGGGTSLVPATTATTVVDLQALGFDDLALDGDRLAIGAMVRLADLAEADVSPPLLRDLARREAPSTIRNVATVGGTVVTRDPESELLAGLLVHDAVVTIATEDAATTVALADYLASRPTGIITTVTVATGGQGTAARTGRTPADRPIVMAAARRGDDGSIAIAVTGVAATPVLYEVESSLDPPSDFRAGADYRRHLATTLVARALDQLDT
jgi:CO/xanthine dehydrogenase FAD-binding subunit